MEEDLFARHSTYFSWTKSYRSFSGIIIQLGKHTKINNTCFGKVSNSIMKCMWTAFWLPLVPYFTPNLRSFCTSSSPSSCTHKFQMFSWSQSNSINYVSMHTKKALSWTPQVWSRPGGLWRQRERWNKRHEAKKRGSHCRPSEEEGCSSPPGRSSTNPSTLNTWTPWWKLTGVPSLNLGKIAYFLSR